MGSDGPKPSAAQAAAVGRIELGPVAAVGSGTIDPSLLFSPGRRQERRQTAVAQSTTGFWPPSMDKVTPVM